VQPAHVIAASVGMKIEGIWLQAVVAEIGLLVPVFMTGFTFGVEYRSHEAMEVHRLGAANLRLDFRSRALHGQRLNWYPGRLPFVFMAAHTGEVLARVNIGSRPHGLNSHAFFIKGLEVNELFDWRFKISAAIGFHGHRT